MEGTTTARRHMPALDGLRALAIGGVVAYHLGAGWARGGYLGVDLFFVLSGFLITGLLLDRVDDVGRSAQDMPVDVRVWRVLLGPFWARRARRLLPALLVLLVVLSALAAAGLLSGPVDLGALRGDGIATLAYVANWHQLFAGQSYFAQFSAPSPLTHTWSLAIEEQFYVLWPLLLLGGVLLRERLRRRGLGGRSGSGWGAGQGRGLGLLWATIGGAVASAGWMAWLAAHGASLDRLYYGTDTRAFDLLAGAALALWVWHRGGTARRQPRPAVRAALSWWRRLARARWPVADGAALGALGVLAFFWWRAGGSQGPPRAMFEGGMALCALVAVVLIGLVRHVGASGAGASGAGASGAGASGAGASGIGASGIGRVLCWAPLRFVGRISYALYLWHWPVIVELSPARTGISGAPLQLVRLAAMTLLAVASTSLLEEPVRRGAFVHWPAAARRAVAPFAMTVTAVVIVASGMVPSTVAAADTGTAPVTEAAWSGLPGSGGLEGQTPIALAGGRRPTAADPLRVLIVGDSVMRAQAPAVVAALGATGAAVVTDLSYPGWGLTTDPSWASDLPGVLRRVRPEVVVGTWSWDDQMLLAHPAAYRAMLERYVSLLLHPGGTAPGAAAVLFEAFPPLGPVPPFADASLRAQQLGRRAGVAAWNTLVAGLPAAFPGKVQYLPVAPAVELHGRFTAWMAPASAPGAPPAQWVRVRSVDDTHFCPAGAARYAAALVEDLHTLVGLPIPGPAWWTGSWQHDAAVYDTPSGSCPADHPTG